MITPDGRRPTIAFFAASLGAALYNEKWQMWSGIAQVAGAHDANLLYVAGGEAGNGPAAVLYDLIHRERASGIISWTGVVTPVQGEQEARTFLERYRPLPVVNVGWHIPGVPGLAFDHAQGMRDLLVHLIEVHGYHKIAYMTRNPEHPGFETRYGAYEETLRRYGLFDARLVGDARLGPPLSTLDRRGLQPGRDYQVIMGTSDESALQLIAELQARGIHVPQEVAVTGFHDGQEARVVVPPLTTVRMPYRAAGRRAAEMLFAMMAGDVVAEQGHVPLEVVVRQSCGCPDARVAQAAAGPVPEAGAPLAIALPAERGRIAGEMAEAVRSQAEGMRPGWATRLIDSWATDMLADPGDGQTQAKRGAFLMALGQTLQEAATAGANIMAWQTALSTLRGDLLPYLAGADLGRAEDLWQQARVLLGQAAARLEAGRVWHLVLQSQVLQEMVARLHVAFDLDELLEIITDGLPRMGIRRCYLALYEDPAQPAAWARLVLACDERGRVSLPAGGLPFPARQLVPAGLLPCSARFDLAVEALYFAGQQIGFVLFEVESVPGMGLGIVHETLRSQISSALKGIQFHHELQEARQKAEEANRLKSRFLSTVSHELRTPLNLIVSLCEMALWQQSQQEAADPAALNEKLAGYQAQIYGSAQHLDRLIRDVLDLTSSQVGQLRLACEPLDLAELLRGVGVMGEQMAQDKRLAWRAEIPGRLPPIWGDRTRLRQVLLNLLSNAVKFTAHGEIVLRAAADNGLVSVCVDDTGLGIPAGEQQAIFDEFHQAENTTARGYGGIGLGLAITRRLVEMHGGQISVASPGATGCGSTFCFTLPAMRGKLNDDRAVEPGPARTVLILAQQPGGGAGLRHYLAGQGFEVRLLELSEDWLERVLAARPGAIVLDCAPGSERGWDLLRVLKEHPATSTLPVLFCTLLEEHERGSLLDVEWLPKPAGRGDLVQVLERYGLVGSPPEKPPAILVVDDEPGVLDVNARLVQSALPGCHLMTAGNGRAALATMQREPPDLVLLDLMMPEMDGFAVLAAMRNSETMRDIPVLVLTGQSLTEEDMARLNQGVWAVLSKGIYSLDETLAHVRTALERDRRLGSEAQRLVRRAQAYIHAHYAEPISRADIARHLGMDEDYLSRCFDRETGLPPMAYLSRYRILQARRLLETTDKSITEVALEVGFASHSYFTRVFQREVGVSPRAYQQGRRTAGQAEA